MQLLEAFKDFIHKEALFSPKEPLLVAVSGGLDSVVLCELCHQAGYDFRIAHANFQLRGEESLRDEMFVAGLSMRYGRQVIVERFDTAHYAAEHKCSIQVAARELRYSWFEKVHDGVILTAHHLDDNIETMVMNFFKGTGIAGLRAMLPVQGIVVRPLLFTGRAEIAGFAQERNLAWVEDSSNDEDKYTRNFFRHQLIPLVTKAYPAAISNLSDNIGRFREIELIYRNAIEQQKRRLLEQRGDELYIPVLKLKQARPLHTLLHEIISPYGFSPHQTEAVAGLLDSGSGRYILSATHRILKDRKWLIVSPLDKTTAAIIPVEKGDSAILFERGQLLLRTEASVHRLDQGPRVALLDATAVRYPLLVRKWKPGDYFYPLGMRKKKKLSRFFIDQRLSLADKEKVWVVEADKRILWVVGYRIDDRFKVGPHAREVLRIEWVPG